MIEWLKRLLGGGPKAPSAAEQRVTALRDSFRKRHGSFRRLLAANKMALEVMAEIEGALKWERPVGMGFVRSRCTRVATNVFQITNQMEAIAPGKYPELGERFRALQAQIGGLLSGAPDVGEFPFVVPLSEVTSAQAEQVGGKMAALGELGRAPDVEIPRGFVATASAYASFIAHEGIQVEIDKTIQSAELEIDERGYEVAQEIGRLVRDAAVPEELSRELLAAYDALSAELGGKVTLAVRSSAIGEDGGEMSFAGQYESILNVDGDELLEAYKRVVASKYTAQAMSYRRRYGIRDEDVPMCVGFLPMIDAVVGGVAYTVNPLDPDDGFLALYAAPGIPESVVSGKGEPDTYLLTRDREPRIAHQTTRGDPVLAEDQAARVAAISLVIETHFGGSQDIEWAIDGEGRVIVLQSRPLQLGAAVETEREGRPIPEGAQLVLEGGVPASSGAAAGKASPMRGTADLDSFEEGSVLVVAQALPVYATLLGRAAAVVTEQGGAASHLANVAREFGVPALFAVPAAMTTLEGRGEVTVDADSARIYAGRVDALVDRPRPERPVPRGAVFAALESAAEIILPLNLLDPASPDFAAASCETFHDMTRFCHEKAVEEMFRFGTQHEFPTRASRRLFTDRATQFWIIDLADGLKDESDDPYFVRLEEVVSIPMLALWRGIQSMAWEGPPPVDARGFLQVLAGSASDPNLDASMPSSYSTGNYFMISRNYCSLQSRFGYHFATVEALVGEHAIENYVSFEFGGGGASRERQHLRARLIADLLEERGFSASAEGDALSARFGGFARGRMEEELAAIGYLLVHTRQLDMVLGDGEAYARYRTKLVEGLEKAASGSEPG